METRLAYLFQQYFDNKSTPEEEQELLAYVRQAQFDDRIRELMDHAWQRLSPYHQLSEQQSDRILSGIKKAALSDTPKKKNTARLQRHPWYWVAASLLVLCVLGGFAYLNHHYGKMTPKTTDQPLDQTQPLATTTSPRLILGNGASIILDSSASSLLPPQGGTQIHKDHNLLSYTAARRTAGNTVYNTIITPKGGQYRVILPDGSKVWLNAASSLRFPTTLGSDTSQRRVTLTGEAYFEVETNARQPFIVHTSGMAVQVLGTHFDIKAYGDEPTVRTTLFNGVVVVSKGNKNVRLNPGQQAITRLEKTADIRVSSADTQSAQAWKNGLFVFHNTDIEAVLRELARWYNTEFVYQGKVKAGLNGVIPRKSDLADVLHMLEVTSNIRFKLKENKIFVGSKK